MSRSGSFDLYTYNSTFLPRTHFSKQSQTLLVWYDEDTNIKLLYPPATTRSAICLDSLRVPKTPCSMFVNLISLFVTPSSTSLLIDHSSFVRFLPTIGSYEVMPGRLMTSTS